MQYKIVVYYMLRIMLNRMDYSMLPALFKALFSEKGHFQKSVTQAKPYQVRQVRAVIPLLTNS